MDHLRREIFQQRKIDLRFRQVDIIQADFGRQSLEHRFFGAVAHLHGDLLEPRTVALRSANFGQLALVQQPATNKNIDSFHDVVGRFGGEKRGGWIWNVHRFRGPAIRRARTTLHHATLADQILASQTWEINARREGSPLPVGPPPRRLQPKLKCFQQTEQIIRRSA